MRKAQISGDNPSTVNLHHHPQPGQGHERFGSTTPNVVGVQVVGSKVASPQIQPGPMVPLWIQELFEIREPHLIRQVTISKVPANEAI